MTILLYHWHQWPRCLGRVCVSRAAAAGVLRVACSLLLLRLYTSVEFCQHQRSHRSWNTLELEYRKWTIGHFYWCLVPNKVVQQQQPWRWRGPGTLTLVISTHSSRTTQMHSTTSSPLEDRWGPKQCKGCQNIVWRWCIDIDYRWLGQCSAVWVVEGSRMLLWCCITCVLCIKINTAAYTGYSGYTAIVEI